MTLDKNILRTAEFPTIWCPGCGHGIITQSVIRACNDMGWNKDDVFAVSGIGCSARTPAYMDFHSIQTTHGRALAFATGMKNDYKLLRSIRMNIMLVAKAYSVKPIDVVSMRLKDKTWLTEEILDGFEIGYRGKLIIHPYQLEVLNSVEFYTLEEIKEYKKVFKYYQENIQEEDAVFSFNDRVYERMHMEEIMEIVEWGRNFYGTDW